MLRILIVEDSVTQREILRRLLAADGEFLVVGEARNGREAVELVEACRPDVVLMDIHMPDMDGVEATREIMRRCPVPIVIASATLKKKDIDLGMAALQAGAISVIEKPEGAVLLHLAKIAPQLRNEIVAAAKVQVRRTAAVKQPARTVVASRAQADITVVGVAASTGGPPVLLEIFSALPKPFPLPVLLVQHISEGFVEGFARWLADTTGQAVRLAANGDVVQPGIWLAPSGRHLALGSRTRIDLPPRRPNDIHCPSADVLFESLAQHAGRSALGVLLTGMGNDGARGLLSLRNVGGTTIVQDEDSSLIWGMPKAAKDLGAAEQELNPSEIVRELATLVQR